MEINSNIAAAAIAADIELSQVVQQSASAQSAPAPQSKDSGESVKLSKEDAKKEAQELEALLNKPADTEIKFNVKLVTTSGTEEEGKVTDFKFQVVEKGTGKIVRQFPPEDINGAKERARTTPAPGSIINSLA